MKKALITGITGQDGSYLAELLLGKGYEVHGVVMENGEFDNPNSKIAGLKDKIALHVCDITDNASVESVVGAVVPDELYHLASQVEPRILHEEERNIFLVNFFSTLNFLSALKKYSPPGKFFLAGSSMQYGNPDESPQNEKTPFRPNTPYGIAKTASFYLVRMYRESYGMFACSAILYNHESPRRDPIFLPRKITKTIAEIKAGETSELVLGDVGAKRDWGFAGDYVEAMYLMLQAEKPKDFVIGTGESHSIEELLDIAGGAAGISWRDKVKIDSNLFRSADTKLLVADPEAIKKELGWTPKTSFKQLIEMMVLEDLRKAGISK